MVSRGEYCPGFSLHVIGEYALIRDLRLLKFQVKDKKSNVSCFWLFQCREKAFIMYVIKNKL